MKLFLSGFPIIRAPSVPAGSVGRQVMKPRRATAASTAGSPTATQLSGEPLVRVSDLSFPLRPSLAPSLEDLGLFLIFQQSEQAGLAASPLPAGVLQDTGC